MNPFNKFFLKIVTSEKQPLPSPPKKTCPLRINFLTPAVGPSLKRPVGSTWSLVDFNPPTPPSSSWGRRVSVSQTGHVRKPNTHKHPSAIIITMLYHDIYWFQSKETWYTSRFVRSPQSSPGHPSLFGHSKWLSSIGVLS